MPTTEHRGIKLQWAEDEYKRLQWAMAKAKARKALGLNTYGWEQRYKDEVEELARDLLAEEA